MFYRARGETDLGFGFSSDLDDCLNPDLLLDYWPRLFVKGKILRDVSFDSPIFNIYMYILYTLCV